MATPAAIQVAITMGTTLVATPVVIPAAATPVDIQVAITMGTTPEATQAHTTILGIQITF